MRANTGNGRTLRAEQCCKGSTSPSDLNFAAPGHHQPGGSEHGRTGDSAVTRGANGSGGNIPLFLGLDPVLTPQLALARRGAVVRLNPLEAYLFKRYAPYTEEERGVIAQLAEGERAHITATYRVRNAPALLPPLTSPAKGPVAAWMLARDPFLKFEDAGEWSLWQEIKADHLRNFKTQHCHSRSVPAAPAGWAGSLLLHQHQQNRCEKLSPEDMTWAQEKQAAKEAYDQWCEHGGNDFPAEVNKFQFELSSSVVAHASSTEGCAHPVESVFDSDGGVSMWANTRLSYEAHTKSLRNHRGLERPTYSDDGVEQEEGAVDKSRHDDDWDNWSP